MKKLFISTALLSTVLMLNSCKSKTEETPLTEAATEVVSNPTETTVVVSEPKSYSINVAPGSPDTILLGKEKEASLKLINMKAIDLSDPDGKSLGIQFSYDIELTNKRAIGGSKVYIDPSTFRLELDNGTKISHDDYTSFNAEAESTVTGSGLIFKLPAGTKPVALNLFLDETRVSVKLEMK